MSRVLLLLAALCALAAVSSAACPEIVNRFGWRGREPRSKTNLTTTPPPFVVVHHGDSGSCSYRDACIDKMRTYQNAHMDQNGWADIGYHFVIGEDGNIYEGRGWDLQAPHAPGYDTQSIGICIVGDFTYRLPNLAALTALNNLIDCGVSLGKITPGFKEIGHRQAEDIACPGNKLYEWLQKQSHWTGSP